MPFVSAAELRSGILRTLLARIPMLEGIKDAEIDTAITIASRMVEEELGCRANVTEIRPWSDASAPDLVEGEETEAPYPWPGTVPGDGFIRIRPRIRPIISVQSLTLKVPGSLIAAYNVPLSWLQVDRRYQEIIIAPTSGTSILGSLLGGMGLGGGLMPNRMPNVVHLTYKAGLGEAGLKTWPQVKRLAEMRAVLYLLDEWALVVNPTSISSQSADGVSQSRSSGFIWKDVAEKLKADADETRDRILSIWNPIFTVL